MEYGYHTLMRRYPSLRYVHRIANPFAVIFLEEVRKKLKRFDACDKIFADGVSTTPGYLRDSTGVVRVHSRHADATVDPREVPLGTGRGNKCVSILVHTMQKVICANTILLLHYSDRNDYHMQRSVTENTRNQAMAAMYGAKRLELQLKCKEKDLQHAKQGRRKRRMELRYEARMLKMRLAAEADERELRRYELAAKERELLLRERELEFRFLAFKQMHGTSTSSMLEEDLVDGHGNKLGGVHDGTDNDDQGTSSQEDPDELRQ